MAELDPSHYTVAWIAPLEIEAQAALGMLDNPPHAGRFPMGRGDDYLFRAGDVAGHNIIIASLPPGTPYGTGSAGALAGQVKKYFPNLWFSLLVGVAAGLPTQKAGEQKAEPRDIRLGDVLVGLPEGDTTGLVSYDLGKDTEDGFQPLRGGYALAMTETIVRSAIGFIKSSWPNEGKLFLPYYEKIEKVKHFKGTFEDPGQANDHLYTDSGEVQRQQRGKSERTQVWYGPIGSGEKLCKNTKTRDELRDRYGLIGLEMEAAGIMNTIPVGVLRGVSDYGDKHKNKQWQPYAAAMAAAFAKAVLKEIRPKENAREKALSAAHTELDKIREWLSAPDPSTNYEEALSKHLEGTGSWFMQSKQYQNWKSVSGQFFWLHGILGCGKTIMTSTILKDLLQLSRQDQTHAVAYYYFDFRDPHKQDSDSMLRSIVTQLSKNCVKPPEKLISLFNVCNNQQPGYQKRKPTSKELIEVLLDVIGNEGTPFLLLDSLDECNDRKLIFEWLRVLMNECSRTHLLATSRVEKEIHAFMEDLVPRENFIELKRNLVDEDIRAYIRSRWSSDCQRWNAHPSVGEEVEKTLMKDAKGMFRWATCQLDVLVKCLTLGKLKHALKSLPKTLEETYDLILCKIPNPYRQYAQSIFTWLTFSKRLLRLEEVAEVTAFIIEENSFDAEEILADPKDILAICSSLISLVDADDDVNITLSLRNSAGNDSARVRTGGNNSHQYVALSHLSVKDYFMSNHIAHGNANLYSLKLVPSSLRIAQSCLIYLLHIDQDSASGVAMTAKFKLAEYSARFWAYHIQDVPETARFPLYGLITQFLMDQERAFKNGESIVNGFRDVTDFSPLQYVAQFSLADIVKLLLDAGASNLDEALKVASGTGRIDTVKLLLKAGASDLDGALENASMFGRIDTVKLLLKAGASNLDGALENASIFRRIDTIKLLLDAGASNLDRSLEKASRFGKINVIKPLLDAGASKSTTS